jgi:hypothetical protein
VAELNRRRRESAEDEPSECVQYSAAGHPSVEQLVAEQGTGPIMDVSVLHGDFWPEEESIEEFLETLHEWRGHAGANPAA